MKRIIFLIILAPISLQLFSQQPSKFLVDGYVSIMPSAGFLGLNGDFADSAVYQASVQNRLNFFWYPTENFSASVQFRNQAIFGKYGLMGDGYRLDKLPNDDYLRFQGGGKAYLLSSTIDRFWLDYTKGDFQARVGRQRINWGQTMVWNPNDIFNTYSYFEVDYPERPGSDAIRLQYYTGFASSLELAAKRDFDSTYTAAFMARLNKWNYDMQFLGGIFKDNDLVLGLGWSGYVKSASFRGELSYFLPYRHKEGREDLLMMSVSTDYTFENSLFLQAEALYSSNVYFNQIDGLVLASNEAVNAKYLALAQYNLFTSASYSISPLLNATLAGMVFFEPYGFFLGPSLSYSLADNATLALMAQSFNGKFIPGTDIMLNYNQVYIQFKLNF